MSALGPRAPGAALAVLLLCGAANAQTIRQDCTPANPCTSADDRSWHLLTITEGGTVTLLKELTKHECEFAMHRARGEPATDEEKETARVREEARSKRDGQPCPPDNATKDDWLLWQKAHPAAQGCVSQDGLGSTSWGGSYTFVIRPGTIKSAECFQ